MLLLGSLLWFMTISAFLLPVGRALADTVAASIFGTCIRVYVDSIKIFFRMFHCLKSFRPPFCFLLDRSLELHTDNASFPCFVNFRAQRSPYHRQARWFDNILEFLFSVAPRCVVRQVIDRLLQSAMGTIRSNCFTLSGTLTPRRISWN